MNAHATPSSINFHGDAQLGLLLEALAPHDAKALLLEYGGRTIRPGYHVTEVKSGSFVTLDCGGNPDAWQETILQVEDLPIEDGSPAMTVRKFRTILAKVAQTVELQPGARLTFEVGPPGTAMQVFDVGTLITGTEQAVIRLVPRAAICKPRHRAEQVTTTCCGSSSAGKPCCG